MNQAWHTGEKVTTPDQKRYWDVTQNIPGGRLEDGVVMDGDELGQRGPLSIPSIETKVNGAKKNQTFWKRKFGCHKTIWYQVPQEERLLWHPGSLKVLRQNLLKHWGSAAFLPWPLSLQALTFSWYIFNISYLCSDDRKAWQMSHVPNLLELPILRLLCCYQDQWLMQWPKTDVGSLYLGSPQLTFHSFIVNIYHLKPSSPQDPVCLHLLRKSFNNTKTPESPMGTPLQHALSRPGYRGISLMDFHYQKQKVATTRPKTGVGLSTVWQNQGLWINSEAIMTDYVIITQLWQ